MASAGRVVQSDGFHLEFNRITTHATEPFNQREQKMALGTNQIRAETHAYSILTCILHEAGDFFSLGVDWLFSDSY